MISFNEKTRNEILEEWVDLMVAKYPSWNVADASVLTNLVQLLALIDFENTNFYKKSLSQLNINTAEGVYLDILAFNIGFRRRSGFKTQQTIKITTDRALTLQGLDSAGNIPYTVADDKNNRYFLKETTALVLGDNDLLFESEEFKPVQSSVGTITNAISNVIGVLTVNNEVAPLQIGSVLESDAIFRNRIISTRDLLATGTEDAFRSQMLSLDGVFAVSVFLNNTTEIQGGVPVGHFYAIIQGGQSEDITRVFARNLITTPTFGSVSGSFTNTQGEVRTYFWDVPEDIQIKIKFTLKSFQGSISDFANEIKNAIAENTNFKVFEKVNVAMVDDIIQKALQDLSINAFPYNTEMNFVGESGFVKFLEPALRKHRLTIPVSEIEIEFIA